MALTSKITKTLDIPGEPSQTVTIRKLSHHHLMMARDALLESLVSKMKLFEGVTLPTVAQPADTNPGDDLDRLTVLHSGVTEWTYGELTRDAIADQDEDWATFVFAEIVAFSLRSAEEVKASGSVSPATSA